MDVFVRNRSSTVLKITLLASLATRIEKTFMRQLTVLRTFGTLVEVSTQEATSRRDMTYQLNHALFTRAFCSNTAATTRVARADGTYHYHMSLV